MSDDIRELVRERLDGIDYHTDKLTVLEAAVLAGVNEAAIRQWKARGHLPAVDADEFGRPLFHGIDVLRAEAKTRHRARRRFPQADDLATRRASHTA